MPKVTHAGITYECAQAIRCDYDKYIKLYDSNGIEMAAFYDIKDFSEYTVTDGSFDYPQNCSFPIPLNTYLLGARVIEYDDWKPTGDGRLYYEIESEWITEQATTCNILLLFEEGTTLEYTATQENGKVTLYISNDPDDLNIIYIQSIQITRVR